jgi:1-acyl-sn-glycerol-3-phosphate acyltransferase
MLRFIGINAFIGVYSVFICIYIILLSIFDRDGKLIHFYATVPWAKVILWVCGVKVKVKGLENVDPDLPRIYMSNHQSYFDIFAFFAGLPIDFKYMLKKELMRIPLFGIAVWRARHISVDRGNPRKAYKSVQKAVEKIRSGYSVLIFPEGTRSPDGHMQPFKRGGFRLALQAGCDIVPVAICNSHNISAKGSLKVNKGVIAINIGKPISIKDYSKKNIDKLMARVREAVIAKLNEEQDSP